MPKPEYWLRFTPTWLPLPSAGANFVPGSRGSPRELASIGDISAIRGTRNGLERTIVIVLSPVSNEERRHAPQSIRFSAALCLAGCAQSGPAPQAQTDTATSGQLPSGPVHSGWTASADGKLRLRIVVSSSRQRTTDKIPVQGILQNVGSDPVSVLRPFGDVYEAQAAGLEIVGPDGRVRYNGPSWSYALGQQSFQRIEPQETSGSFLELLPENIEAVRQPGQYRLRFRYAARDAEYAEWLGFPDLWTGEITSDWVVFVRGDVARPQGPQGSGVAK